MRFRNFVVIAVVVLVALSGCAAFGPGADDPSNDTGEDENQTDANDTNESDGENDSSDSDTEASEDSADDPEENASDPGDADDASANGSAENATDEEPSSNDTGENASDADEETQANGSDERSNESDGGESDGFGEGDGNSTDSDENGTGQEVEDDGSDANDADANESDSEDGNSSGLEDRTDDSDDTDEGGDGDSDGDDTVDETADAEWSPPEEPNRPLERKDDNADRIESIEFVDTEPAADGEGYSNFNVEVVANTSMESVDPPEHGDVVGEPYFFVKINEGADNQKIVERTGEVEMTENGTFHIPVRPDGLTEFGEREDLTVEVFLLDEDKDWDDVYDAGSETIHFNPETDDSGANGTDDSGANGTDD